MSGPDGICIHLELQVDTVWISLRARFCCRRGFQYQSRLAVLLATCHFCPPLSVLHLRHVAGIMVTVTVSEWDSVSCSRTRGITLRENGCCERSKHWLYNNDHYIYNREQPPSHLSFLSTSRSVSFLCLIYSHERLRQKKGQRHTSPVWLCTSLKFHLASTEKTKTKKVLTTRQNPLALPVWQLQNTGMYLFQKIIAKNEATINQSTIEVHGCVGIAH